MMKRIIKRILRYFFIQFIIAPIVFLGGLFAFVYIVAYMAQIVIFLLILSSIILVIIAGFALSMYFYSNKDEFVRYVAQYVFYMYMKYIFPALGVHFYEVEYKKITKSKK